MKFKIDENLSPSLAAMFEAAGHDAHSVVQQVLGGQPDERIIDVCSREQRALITLDLDFSNILTTPQRSIRASSCAACPTKRILRSKPQSIVYWIYCHRNL